MTDMISGWKHETDNTYGHHERASAGKEMNRDDEIDEIDDMRSNSPVNLSNKKSSVDGRGRRELTEKDCPEVLAYAWPTWKKWMYLCSVAGIQISMNYNTSVYPSAIKPLATAFDIGQQESRAGQMIYLVLYSFGCELWAPWSEEFGRWPILQLSMFLISKKSNIMTK
jgi:hypothetical protein